MESFKAIAIRISYGLAGTLLGLMVTTTLNYENLASAVTAIATSILAIIAGFGAYVAYIELAHLAQIRSESFIESMNSKFDSEEMREDRQIIYKNYKPDPDTVKRADRQDIKKRYQPNQETAGVRELADKDKNAMERVWNYLDAMGFLMLENRRLRKKGLKLWSYNFARCWLCMEPYIILERNDRGNPDFLMYFQHLFDKSRKHLKKQRKLELQQLKWR